MADVFISYASEDRDRAGKLASALTTLGWSVWWDRKIVTGQTFDQAIERELETAKSVVVLWSIRSVESEWVKNEASLASERGVLVPAMIDSVKLPLEFRRKQTADQSIGVVVLPTLAFKPCVKASQRPPARRRVSRFIPQNSTQGRRGCWPES